MIRFFILLLVGFLLLGCVTAPASVSVTPSAAASAAPSPSTAPEVVSATPSLTASPTEYSGPSLSDVPPRISSSSARPSNPDRNEPFILEASAEDDAGLKSISWESSDALSSQPESRSSDCGLKTTCSASFTFKAASEGDRTISLYAVDSSGQESARSTIKITVRPFDYKEPTPIPSVTASPSVAISSPSVSADVSSCTSNEACGYKQICQDGTCVDVDCTNDSHCGYGKECSYYSCVRCRVGPYGPAC